MKALKKIVFLMVTLCLCASILSGTVFAYSVELYNYYTWKEYQAYIKKGNSRNFFVPYEMVSMFGEFHKLAVSHSQEYESENLIYYLNCPGRNKSIQLYVLSYMSFFEKLNLQKIASAPYNLKDWTNPNITFEPYSSMRCALVNYPHIDEDLYVLHYLSSSSAQLILHYKNLYFSVYIDDEECTCSEEDKCFLCRLCHAETAQAAVAEWKEALADLPEYTPPSSATTPAPVPQNESNPLRYLIIPVAIVAVGGTAGLVWHRKRKRIG